LENNKKPYKKPILEKIVIDTDFSLIMMTEPPTSDPPF